MDQEPEPKPDRSLFVGGAALIGGAAIVVAVLILAAPASGLVHRQSATAQATVSPQQFANALSTLTAPPPAPPTRVVEGTATPLPGGYGAQPLPTAAAGTEDASAAQPPAVAVAPQIDVGVATPAGATNSLPAIQITRIPTETPAPAAAAPGAVPAQASPAADSTNQPGP